MPPSPSNKRGKADGAAAGGGDRISALPDDALHHVLWFLPAEEAVRTCVLARRWRHLWKSATGLRIWYGHLFGRKAPSVEKFQEFVNHVLLLRKRDSSLHACELRLYGRHKADEKLSVNLWVRHIIECGVRMFRLEIRDICFRFDLPLVSHHLTMLALVGVALTNNLCNFSNCPNLEHLEFASSDFDSVQKISSNSLKHLSISSSCNFDKGLHTLICTPSLVSLRLDMHFSSLPVLDSMPSLKEAFLRDPKRYCCDEDCYTCKRRDALIEYEYNKCILLQGLSEAENLTLMSNYNGVYFRRDLEWCPTFNNLRTLLLNEWCVDPDFYGLDCILKHSPVLEKLALHLFSKGHQHKVEMIGRYNQIERSATISKNLKEIRIKCDVVNEQVHKVFRFLGTFGICKRLAEHLFSIII